MVTRAPGTALPPPTECRRREGQDSGSAGGGLGGVGSVGSTGVVSSSGIHLSFLVLAGASGAPFLFGIRCAGTSPWASCGRISCS